MFQKERVLKGEIDAATISNYYKPVKLFCDVNDILVNWKFISRGIPKGKHASDDRAPTLEEMFSLFCSSMAKSVFVAEFSSRLFHGAKQKTGKVYLCYS